LTLRSKKYKQEYLESTHSVKVNPDPNPGLNGFQNLVWTSCPKIHL